VLDLNVTILGLGYHVTFKHVPELAGMRWNRIDQHLIRYYQNILQATRVLLRRYIKHLPLHVNTRTDRKIINTKQYSKILQSYLFCLEYRTIKSLTRSEKYLLKNCVVHQFLNWTPYYSLLFTLFLLTRLQTCQPPK
jgi:hypothetical protein